MATPIREEPLWFCEGLIKLGVSRRKIAQDLLEVSASTLYEAERRRGHYRDYPRRAGFHPALREAVDWIHDFKRGEI